MKPLALIFFLILSQISFAQKETNNWFFGCHKALTFNSGKPVSIKDGGWDTRRGCSVISNSKGRMLFYVSEMRVTDSTQNGMSNGTLTATEWTSQPYFIVPWPDSSHLYYVFTSHPFTYSIVNMKLRGGLGDIETNKKQIGLPTPGAGKITGIIHANKRDYWVVVPQGSSDSINAYLITSKGIVTTPVKSATGVYSKTGGTWFDEYSGYFKISPNGQKICNINRGTNSMIADFDAITGKVSNIWEFRTYGMGVEFSAKSKYLYVTSINNSLCQYDLSLKNKTDFLASKKTIDSVYASAYSQASLQLASDGKIYIYHWSNKYLDVIHARDSQWTKARVEKNYFQYQSNDESSGHYGLPNFVQSFFYKPSFDYRSNCIRDSVFFTIIETYDLDSAKWDFGDTASGINNTSIKTSNVFHSYKNPGYYKVRLVSFYKTRRDTIYETVFVNYAKPFLGKDSAVCTGDYIALNPLGVYKEYKWSTGESITSIFVSKSGNYHLTVTDFDGCKTSDTMILKNASVKADFTISNPNQCFKNNTFDFKETTKYTNDIRKKTTWYISDNTILSDTLLSKTFLIPGEYSVKLISESKLGCMDSSIKKISVYQSPKAVFTINDSIQCLNENSFDFILNKDTGKVSYVWDLSDIQIPGGSDVKSMKYGKEGNYKISLMAETDKKCKDTLHKFISILPSPEADFSWGLTCQRTPVKFQYTGSKPIQTYSWDFSGEGSSSLENPSNLFNSAGTKKVGLKVISSNGCEDVLKKDILVKPQSKADFETKDICETDSAAFKNLSADATNYNWRFGDGLKSNSVSPKHKYQIGSSTTFNVTLVAVVADGCSDSIVKAITVSTNPKADFTFTSKNGKVDFKTNLSGTTSYKWFLGNGDSSITVNPNFSYTYSIFPALYNVCLQVSNNANCFSKTCKEVSVLGGVSNYIKPQGFKLYPNPNSGNFTIEIENPGKDVSIEVYNSLGELVKKIERVEKISTLDLNVANGIYLVRVKNGNGVWNQEMVVSVGGDTKR